MHARYALCAALIAASFVGCHKRDRSAVVVGQAEAASTRHAEANAAAAALAADDDSEGQPGKGSGTGINRWKDVIAYADGRPIGAISFGELPIGLKPTWVPEEHSIEFDYGYKGPRTRTSYARRYRVIDYLKAAGVDVARIKEIQIMGPKESMVLIASGKELRSKKGQDLMFRFGAVVGGKPIPVVPDKFGNGVMADKMGGMFVYLDKKPPVLAGDEDSELMLDGKPVDGVPYFGDPLRGGIRVYVDDRLSLALKPSMLQEAPAEVGPDGKKRWKLTTILKQNGVDLSKVQQGWAIADERRKEKYTRAELDALTVTTNPEHKSQIVVGDGKLRVTALALHSHELAPSELPQIRPDEDID